MLSQTKQEFVTHIKTFHMDVVDEDILQSLEQDLRKTSRKLKKLNKLKKKRLGGSSGGRIRADMLRLPPGYNQKLSKKEKLKRAKQSAAAKKAAMVGHMVI